MSTGASPNLGFTHRFESARDATAPTLLLLHGTGGDENDLLPLGRAIVPGAALLSPRGKVLENGMPRFFRRLAEGVFDQEDLAFRTRDLAEFIDAASENYGIDRTRLFALGFSNGANMAASVLLRFPEKLAGAILIRAMVPFVPKQVPDLRGKSVLLLSGREDPIVPTDQAEELADIFKSAGADVTLHWENAGHALTQGDVSTARDWLPRVLYTS
ncbi:MAG: alpha/beta hydrolase [Bryobacteraceae bacterium]